jgi:hypothetical protein
MYKLQENISHIYYQTSVKFRNIIAIYYGIKVKSIHAGQNVYCWTSERYLVQGCMSEHGLREGEKVTMTSSWKDISDILATFSYNI